MTLRLTNLRLDLEMDESSLINLAARKLNVSTNQIKALNIVKKALDARKKDKLVFVYTVDVELNTKKSIKVNPPFVDYAPLREEDTLPMGECYLSFPPVIVGSGPAGLFSALVLASRGYRPLILERGLDVDSRNREINNFWNTGELNTNCNVQFGEGGAGTFSDGKLTTRVKDKRVGFILEQLVEAGAPEEILYINKPHIGTDLLRVVVKNLRQRLIDLGATVIFDAQVTDLSISQNKLAAIKVNKNTEIPAQVGIMAIGHSARDTYEMLYKSGVAMEDKPLAIGLRVEHEQRFIDQSQYGKFAGHPKLGAADYALAYQDKEKGRGAYSFCMCPGGHVVAAASEEGGVVTNGMSEHARDGQNANSALVVTVDVPDFGEGCLKGIEFQRKYEKKAFKIGGGGYQAPAQKIDDFLADRASTDLEDIATPSYRPGVTPANLRDCLPKEVGEVLGDAIRFWDHKIKGFAHENGVLTGVETRTSAPVRILRKDDFESINTLGIYPAGEGAGYAGGIVSAALDGIKVAEAIITKYQKPEGDFLGSLLERVRKEVKSATNNLTHRRL